MKSVFFVTAHCLLFLSIGYVATDIYLPSLPALADHFHATEGSVQMTLSAFLLAYALTPLITGPLSDRYGRKKVIASGLFIALLATIGCYFSTSIFQLIGFRLLQGLGTGSVALASRAMILDLFSGKTLARQMSYITMSMPIMLASAPAIGGLLQEAYGWQMVFMFLGCYIAVVLGSVILLEEPLKHKSKHTPREALTIYKDILQNHRFLLFGFGQMVPTIGMFAYFTASPFLFQEVIGLSPAEYGYLATYISGMIVIASYVNAQLLRRLDITTIILIGTGLMTLSGILMLGFHLWGIMNTWTVLLPTLLFFCCLPMNISNSVSRAMQEIKGHFGSATAVLTTLQFLAGALVSFVFSVVKEENAAPLAFTFLLVGLSSATVLFFARKSIRKVVV